MRRVLAVLVGVAGLWGGAYLFFMVFLLGQTWLPLNSTLPLSLFLGCALPVVLTSMVAARPDRSIAAVTVGLVTVALAPIAVRKLDMGIWPVVVAANGTTALVLFFCAIRRRFAYGLTALFLALLAGSFFDWPAWPDHLPYDLRQAAQESAASLASFHRYRLYGFIDSADLWRIDGSPEVIEAAAGKLGMSPATAAPEIFWQMPPYYWPRSLPAGARLYATPNFPAEDRGRDGSYYFLLLDPIRRRTVVWAKHNF